MGRSRLVIAAGSAFILIPPLAGSVCVSAWGLDADRRRGHHSHINSPGTAVFDYGAKLSECQGVASVDTVTQIESEIALVKVHERQKDGTWTEETFEEFESLFRSTRWQRLTLNAIYDTLEVKPQPRLQVVRSVHTLR